MDKATMYRLNTRALFEARLAALEKVMAVRSEFFAKLRDLGWQFDTAKQSQAFHRALTDGKPKVRTIAREYGIPEKNIKAMLALIETSDAGLAKISEEEENASDAFETADKKYSGVDISVWTSDSELFFCKDPNIQAVRTEYRKELVAIYDKEPTRTFWRKP
jgi:hypothetical protein